MLLAGTNDTLPPRLQLRLSRLGVSIRRIQPLSDFVPSLNKLYAFLLSELRKACARTAVSLVNEAAPSTRPLHPRPFRSSPPYPHPFVPSS